MCNLGTDKTESITVSKERTGPRLRKKTRERDKKPGEGGGSRSLQPFCLEAVQMKSDPAAACFNPDEHNSQSLITSVLLRLQEQSLLAVAGRSRADKTQSMT